MGKKKDKSKGSNYFEYYTGSGKIGELMDRFDIKGVRSVKPDNIGATPDSYNRSKEDVDRDIAKAMMNDYDYRRSMEAAAMAGNKDAKKFAKKGFKGGNIYDAQQTMRDLKDEYVGGGGMNGPKNIAGLTHALVKADREAQTAQYKEDFALNSDLAALRKEMEERGDKKSENVTPATLSETAATANDMVGDYDLNLGSFGTNLFGGGGSPAEQGAAEEFKEDAVATVKKGIQLSDVETRGPKSGFKEGEGF